MKWHEDSVSPLMREVNDQVLPSSSEAAKRFPVTRNPDAATAEQHAEAMTELAFGTRFSDHMATMSWNPTDGWHDRKVQAFGPLSLSPAAAVLHYSQEIFEGLKAFKWEDGSIWTFRPGFNSARFNQSARRMDMPEVRLEDFIGSIVQTVSTDSRWVPKEGDASLYLRPFMIADEPYLGVRPARNYLYALITSPVGAFFKDGLNPVSIYVSDTYHRAAPGGTGAAKTGGNYSASMLPQRMADHLGFEQVCYLDAATNKNLEELGGMNLFVIRKDGTAQTPRLTGTILEGGTRSAIIQLLSDRGTKVEEVDIPIKELVEDIRSGEVTELFACGTAALVTPIGRLGGDGFDLEVNGTEVSLELYSALSDIQRGRAEDPHGWMYCISEG